MSGWLAMGVFLFGTGMGALVTRMGYSTCIRQLRAQIDQIRSQGSILMGTSTADSAIGTVLLSGEKRTAELTTKSLGQFAASPRVRTEYGSPQRGFSQN